MIGETLQLTWSEGFHSLSPQTVVFEGCAYGVFSNTAVLHVKECPI